MAAIEATAGARIAPTPEPRRDRSIKVFYGLGSIAFGVKDNGFSVLLLLYYNQVLGLDAKLAGLAIMLALLVDAVVDPVIGYASDHLHSRWGRRHPFMYAAAIPVALSYLLLFSPPTGLAQQQLFFYLLAVAITVRVCIAFYEIPSAALVAELTEDYDQRTSYLSYRFFFGWIGGLTMSMLAFSVFLRATPEFPVGQLNPAGYASYGQVAAAIMFIAILVSAIGTHSAIPRLKPPPEQTRQSLGARFGEIVATIGSRSALSILLAGMLVALATGLTFALVTYFYTYFWELSPAQISILVSGSYVSATLALLIAPILSRRADKRASAIACALAMICLIPIPYAARFAGFFPSNDASALLPTLFAFSVVTTTLSIIWGILLTSMIADVVEDNEVRTGQRSEGVFFAVNTFIAKCVSGLGVFASTAILEFARFPAKAVPGELDRDVLFRLATTYAAAVIVLNLIAALIVLSYRITRAKHLANLQTLATRAVGAAQSTQ